MAKVCAVAGIVPAAVSDTTVSAEPSPQFTSSLNGPVAFDSENEPRVTDVDLPAVAV